MLPDNRRLAAALAAAGDRDSASAHREVLDAILEGTLIVALGPGSSSDAPVVAASRVPGGALCAMAFSGPETLAMWGATNRAASGSGRAMAALIRDQGLAAAAIDAAGPVAVVLEHAELRALASGVTADDVAMGGAAPTAGRPAPLRLHAPDPPLEPAVAAALAGALAGHPVVSAAYLFEGPAVGDRRHLVVGLDLPEPRDPVALAAAVDAVDAAVAPLVAPAAGVDYTVIERDAVFDALRDAVPAAYERR